MAEILEKPWLVAVWPGLGGVAQIAGVHLVKQLGAKPYQALAPDGFFEPASVSVRNGRLQAHELPRSVFHTWRNPKGGRDLIILLAEAQPSANAQAYAEALIRLAVGYGVERVFTFAAMATPIHPSTNPRVFAAGTTDEVVVELRRDGVVLLEEGEIGGLNGVFLAAAAAQGVPGVCLLGEFPFYAAAVPNPKASAAVLTSFAKFAGIDVETSDLKAEAQRLDRALLEHLDILQRAASKQAQDAEAALEEAEREAEFAAKAEEPKEPEIQPEALARIESLFAQARVDRGKAMELKSELDRRGLFERFEDRFLDLFKKAG
jgi:proteasome assembly chaperone (PAC2) family protein